MLQFLFITFICLSFAKHNLKLSLTVAMAILLPGAFTSDNNNNMTETITLNNEHADNKYNLSNTTGSYGDTTVAMGDDSNAQMLFFAKAETYGTFKVGNCLQKYYFPIFIPIGVLGKYCFLDK